MNWDLLKRCLRRQVIPEGMWVDLTPFGRAIMTGYRPFVEGGPPGFYVLYWIKLPSWQWMEDFITLQNRWHQLVLFFHGRTGFELRWVQIYEQPTT